MSAFRGQTAIVGIGQTPYYKRGTSPDPEVKLCMRAIVAACEDAGIRPADIDGFVSYGSERNDGAKLMTALGTKELRFSSLVWTHGGGIPGALGLAASAIISGQAQVVAVYRAMAQSDGGRLRTVVAQGDTPAQYLVNGIENPIQIGAFRAQRMLEKLGVPRATMKALALASYHHARNNPTAYGRNVVLDEETYDSSRYVAEPYRLFDCSRENDASAAVIVVSAERAKDYAAIPAYILSAPMGNAGHLWGTMEEIDQRSELMHTAGFSAVADRLWKESGFGPQDVDVAQIYDNMTGLAVAAILDHGFCSIEDAGSFIAFDNLIAPHGVLPVNTSGGSIADGFIHGMGLVNEAVRQIRGESHNQVPDAKLSLMTGGPGDVIVSSALLGTEETLQ